MKTTSSSGWPVTIAMVALASATAAAPTPIDLESARELWREGKKLREAGKLIEAIEKFRAAWALAPTPITGLDLAKTLAMVGKLVEGTTMVTAAGVEVITAGVGAEAAAVGAGGCGRCVATTTIAAATDAPAASISQRRCRGSGAIVRTLWPPSVGGAGAESPGSVGALFASSRGSDAWSVGASPSLGTE